MRSEEIFKKINRLNAEDPFVKSVLDAVASQIDLQDSRIQTMNNNQFFDTATEEMIEFYEEECGITPKASQSLSDRGSAISARWKSEGKVGIALIQSVADSWNYGKVVATFEDSTIKITFVDKGIPIDLDGLKTAVDEIKPAHLPASYIFIFSTWGEVKKKTWFQIKQSTWSEVKNK